MRTTYRIEHTANGRRESMDVQAMSAGAAVLFARFRMPLTAQITIDSVYPVTDKD